VAVKTGELAAKTNAVAQVTGELARDTVDASRWADQHHQEQFSPIVVWDVARCEYRAASTTGTGSTSRGVYITGDLRNIGGGPAMNIKAFVEMGGYKSDPNKPLQLGTLAAGEGRIDYNRSILDVYGFDVFDSVGGAEGPFTITIWAMSQFGTLIESKMVKTDLKKRTEAVFTRTPIKERVLPTSRSG